MDYFARFVVEQDVLAVSVAEAEDVPEDGTGGYGARVCEALFEPDVWVFEAFHEEVAEDRVELVADLAVDFDAVVDGSGLRV